MRARASCFLLFLLDFLGEAYRRFSLGLTWLGRYFGDPLLGDSGRLLCLREVRTRHLESE